MISNTANTRGVGPNVSTEQDSFFQSDRDIQLASLRKKKETEMASIGNPITMSSKVLDLKLVNDRYAYAALSGFNCIKIDLLNGLVLQEFIGHKGPVTSIDIQYINGIDSFIFTGSWDKTVKKWDVRTRKCLFTCEYHSDFVKSVVIHGQKFYSSSTDGMIACWDIESGKLLGTLSGHTRAVEDMVITPNGKTMYSCSSDMTIRKWDLELLQPVDILRGHLTTVFKLVLLFDDDSLWSVSADKTAIRWYLPTSEIDTKLEHPDFVKSITVLNSGFVITGCRDEKIRVWEPSTDRCVAEINAHFGEVSSLQSCGVTFWSGSLDCTIRSWNILSVLNDFKIEKKEEQQIESLMTEEEEKELAELMDD